MTRDDIIRMAREAGTPITPDMRPEDALQIAFALGAVAEREACAAICDDQMEIREINTAMAVAAGNCADLIRARGE